MTDAVELKAARSFRRMAISMIGFLASAVGAGMLWGPGGLVLAIGALAAIEGFLIEVLDRLGYDGD